MHFVYLRQSKEQYQVKDIHAWNKKNTLSQN